MSEACTEEKHHYADTDEIICPYCGFKYSDSWELCGRDCNSGEEICPDCEKEFEYRVQITVDYFTFRKEETTHHD